MGKKELHDVWEAWHADLQSSRDLSPRERDGYSFLLRWFLKWIESRELLPGRPAARSFWKAQVLSRERESWQLDQWKGAILWYLDWLELVSREQGMTAGPSLAQRVHRSVMDVGARRGLAYRTRRSYAGWCRRYATRCSSREEVLDESHAASWLGSLVTETKTRQPSRGGEGCGVGRR